MQITSLIIQNFRNYAKQSVRFHPGINFFVGNNAQGKTNLLEALYLTSVGRSPRTPRDREMIRSGAERAIVRLQAEKRAGKDTVEIVLDKKVNKRIAISGVPITRIGELMGVVPTVFFSPDEMRIVKEAPSDRRRFLDIALSQISKSYFYLLNKYNKVIAQRNKLLKSGNYTEDSLLIWDEQLADCGARLVKSRKGFVKRLQELAQENHLFITDGLERLELSYEGLEGDSTAEIKEAFLRALRSIRERDAILGYTGVGPHKDDIRILVNAIDVRSYGSQGQQRSAALSLKLAELDIVEEERQESPALLLDDVFSELDKTRCNKLLQKIHARQVFITCTHVEADILRAVEGYQILQIQNGKVTSAAKQ